MRVIEQARLRIVAQGKVQGVFFRVCAQNKAQELKLKGWVRNLSDGSVEAVAEGNKQSLNDFLDWFRQGPPSAIVRHVDLEWGPHANEFQKFSIRY